MLQAEKLYKQYSTKKRTGILKRKKVVKLAINNISLTIPRGKIVGVLGENGAGKTTLIKMLTTLLLPDSGEILLDNQDINLNLKNTRNKINMIAGGERNLYWRLTPIENLQYFGSLYGLSKSVIASRTEILLKQLDLWEERQTPVEQFSKGMKQRLQIAKGLINDPDYLFLDEPTLGLDIQIAKNLRQTIKNLSKNENKGILLTTHYMAEAEELCDYIYIIHKGSIILSGDKEMVFSALNLQKQLIIKVTLQSKIYLTDILNQLNLSFNICSKSGYLEIQIFTEKPELQKIIDLFSKKKIEIQQIQIVNPTLEMALLKISESGFNYGK